MVMAGSATFRSKSIEWVGAAVHGEVVKDHYPEGRSITMRAKYVVEYLRGVHQGFSWVDGLESKERRAQQLNHTRGHTVTIEPSSSILKIDAYNSKGKETVQKGMMRPQFPIVCTCGNVYDDLVPLSTQTNERTNGKSI